jgi:hypothetical protein
MGPRGGRIDIGSRTGSIILSIGLQQDYFARGEMREVAVIVSLSMVFGWF